jgi:hypothetical protein
VAEFIWLSDYPTKYLVDEQLSAFCTALVAKLATCSENLVAKCFFTCHGDQNGCSMERCNEELKK